MISMQPNRQTSARIAQPNEGGFALVVTLSLMILLTVIAVGLLSLSSISLRASSQGDAAATARANARMALILAIGELQRQTGLDTRVTATATIQDDTKPAVLGAWKSWEGTDHEISGTFAGRPKAPDLASKMQFNSTPADPTKTERFLGWLTSRNASDPSYLPDTIFEPKKEVTLVGKGSVGSGTGRDKLQIHLEPTTLTVSNRKSSLAWWIGGENQKARLPKPIPTDDKPSTVAGWSALAKSHTVVDPKLFRMDDLLTDPTPANKAISLKQGDFIAPKLAGLTASQEFFHDLSATSVGLLTNTATGGWRKDFSLLSENWSGQPTTGLPLFQVEPGKNLDFARPSTGNPTKPRSIFYPWSAYRNPGDPDAPMYMHGAVSSWENLMLWSTLYKTMGANGTTIPTQSARIHVGWPGGLSAAQKNQSRFDYLHKVRVIPIIARVQWVFSYAAIAGAPASAANSSGTFRPRLLISPVFTLWNPYNVEIKSSTNLEFSLNDSLPNAFKFTVNNVPNTKFNSISKSINYSPSLTASPAPLQFKIAAAQTFKPGETILFSPTSATPVNWNTSLPLAPGYRTGGGHLFPIVTDVIKPNGDSTEYPTIPGEAIIKAEVAFDSTFKDTFNPPYPEGVGLHLSMQIGGAAHLAYIMKYDPAVARVVCKTVIREFDSLLRLQAFFADNQHFRAA